MKTMDFKEKIQLYITSNPNLSQTDFGILLLLDHLYNDVPSDIEKFYQLNAHLDPRVIDNSNEGIMFLQMVNSNDPEMIIKHRLNNYINIKYNYLGHAKDYAENMKKFKVHAEMVTRILEEILEASRLPAELTERLRELPEVSSCTDFYNLLKIYKESDSRRTKFEILRKIGLIVLIARISRSFLIDDINFALEEIKHVFQQGLGLTSQDTESCFLWIDEADRVKFVEDLDKAEIEYKDAVITRNSIAKPIYPMQIFEYTPHKTKFNSRILHIEYRNKFIKAGEISYTSFIEKMIRKNLEFPNQVHDVLGIKMVVRNEDEIPQLIKDLATFLGGNTTRKKEKNSFQKFGKRSLSKYSSKDYFVWKAIYDIALPHPSIFQVSKIVQLAGKNTGLQKELMNRLRYFKNRPQDFVVEVQIQDLNSHLLSIAKGSPTDHAFLKMNQIRSNSFYKFFPQEIYEPVCRKLRKDMLERQTSGSSSSSSSSDS